MTTLLHRIAKWRALSLAEQGLLLALLGLLPLCFIMLRGLDFKRCSTLLDSLSERIQRGQTDQAVSIEQARRIAWVIAVAARFGPYRANCLVRSLMLRFLLRCRGLECQLRIGSRRLEGRFEAHAWIVLNGQVINDQADIERRFVPFQLQVESHSAFRRTIQNTTL